jgi:hypothetical protein
MAAAAPGESGRENSDSAAGAEADTDVGQPIDRPV